MLIDNNYHSILPHFEDIARSLLQCDRQMDGQAYNNNAMRRTVENKFVI